MRRGAPRVIKAAQSGTCSSCPGEVRIGDRIWWTPGRAAVQHEDCAASRRAHAEADAKKRRSEAARALEDAFAGAPEEPGMPEGWTHAVREGFPGWAVVAHLTPDRVFLSDTVPERPGSVRERRRERGLPRTPALEALLALLT